MADTPPEQRSYISSIPRENLTKLQAATMRYTWRGVLCNKNPFDLALYPMLLWEAKPGTIIEIGSKMGGSALWLDDLCIRFGLQTKLVSIDIDQRAKVRRNSITFWQGDGRDLRAVLTPEILAGLPRPWIVIEDADHHYLTTKAVIEFFAPVTRPGDYLLIEDGICDSFGNQHRYDGGPNRAVTEFLAGRPGIFEVDTRWCDFFGFNVTWNPNGYLRRL